MSGATGTLRPADDPTVADARFIDEDRSDWIFFGRPTISVVWYDGTDFTQYASLTVYGGEDCQPYLDFPVYLATMILDVPETASGTFDVCLSEDTYNRTFMLICPYAITLSGSNLDQLTEASFLGLLSYDRAGPPGEDEQYFIGRFQRSGPGRGGSDVAIPGPPDVVPEPLTLLLFGSGLTGLWWARRRQS